MTATTSFSADSKDALARELPEAVHCRNALRNGLALYGSDAAGKGFVTQRNSIARLFRTLSHQHAPIEKRLGMRLRRAPYYRIELLEDFIDWPPKPVHRCDRVMEARGAMLACGSISGGSHGYHLEFVTHSGKLADRLAWTLRAISHEPKRTVRKGRDVLYYKDFDAIVDVLTVIGAHGAVLRLEDVRALKETKNRIHRLVNTEAANLQRSAQAATVQRRTIEFVAGVYGLRRLPAALREMAELRLAHPDESLSELGRRCDPPVGKPTVNSRMGAIARLARRLQG